jgi:hypothetical protein
MGMAIPSNGVVSAQYLKGMEPLVLGSYGHFEPSFALFLVGDSSVTQYGIDPINHTYCL